MLWLPSSVGLPGDREGTQAATQPAYLNSIAAGWECLPVSTSSLPSLWLSAPGAGPAGLGGEAGTRHPGLFSVLPLLINGLPGAAATWIGVGIDFLSARQTFFYA